MSAATAGPAGAAPYRPPRIVRWVGVLSEASGWLSAVALVLATLVTGHAVFVRYFLRQPTVWQTETTIYLLMVVAFVGAAYGLKHHAHVGVDLIIDRIPLRPQLITRMVTALMCLAVIAVITWTSYEDWIEAYLYDFRSPTAFRFPLWIAYAILPLGMLLTGLQYVAMIVEGAMALAGRIPITQVSMMTGVSELSQVQSELELEEELHDEDAAHEDGPDGDEEARS